MAPDQDNTQYDSRLQELEEIEEEERQKLVKEALGKFNFFLHITAWSAGCAYLILLGVFVPKALPYVFIPIGLWTAGLAYHMWRAWHPGTRKERALQKVLKQLAKEEALRARAGSPDGGPGEAQSPGDR